MVWYNNILSIPLVMMLVVCFGEHKILLHEPALDSWCGNLPPPNTLVPSLPCSCPSLSLPTPPFFYSLLCLPPQPGAAGLSLSDYRSPHRISNLHVQSHMQGLQDRCSQQRSSRVRHLLLLPLVRIRIFRRPPVKTLNP